MSNQRTLMKADRSFRTRRVTSMIDEDIPVLNVSHHPPGCYDGFSIDQIRGWINALIEQRIADGDPWPTRVGFDLSDADIEDDWESVLAMRPTATAVEKFDDETFEEHDWMANLVNYSIVNMIAVYEIFGGGVMARIKILLHEVMVQYGEECVAFTIFNYPNVVNVWYPGMNHFGITPKQAHCLADELHRLADRAEVKS